jgi:hypothetical protein
VKESWLISDFGFAISDLIDFGFWICDFGFN